MFLFWTHCNFIFKKDLYLCNVLEIELNSDQIVLPLLFSYRNIYRLVLYTKLRILHQIMLSLLQVARVQLKMFEELAKKRNPSNEVNEAMNQLNSRLFDISAVRLELNNLN